MDKVREQSSTGLSCRQYLQVVKCREVFKSEGLVDVGWARNYTTLFIDKTVTG